MLAHAKALQISKAKYPVKRPTIKVINLPSGQSSFSLDNVITGQLPNKIILGMVSNDAYVGSNTTNSLRFQPFDINYLALNVNGKINPRIPYQPDFRNNKFCYQREYYDFLMNSGQMDSDFTLPADYANYRSGMCLFAFNLNSELHRYKNSNDIPNNGFISIDVKFRSNLSNAIKMIVYSQFDNIIEIDEHRNVTIDY